MKATFENEQWKRETARIDDDRKKREYKDQSYKQACFREKRK